MKYKTLVGGKNTFVFDFLKHNSSYFKAMSTSEFYKDVILHFELFQPDVYIIFAEAADDRSVVAIKKLKNDLAYNEAYVIVVASSEVCEEIKKLDPFVVDLFIMRPIHPDNLSLKISRFLDERAEQKNGSGKETNNDDAQTPAENIDPNAKKHILVVDDDRNILKMVKSILENEYEITSTVNGILVQKIINSKQIDLIILDHEMPIETGAEVFRKLKEDPIGKNIPVCFLTGIADKETIAEIMKLKPHGYLLKPINVELLTSTIKNILQ